MLAYLKFLYDSLGVFKSSTKNKNVVKTLKKKIVNQKLPVNLDNEIKNTKHSRLSFFNR